MTVESIIAIQQALDAAKVRFIVVGGLAVIAHGYLRATQDADIVIELVPDSIANAFKALEKIGYRPRLPITAEQFSDPALRRKWSVEKNMTVLQFWSDAHPQTPLDIFVEHPFDFRTEWQNATTAPLAPSLSGLRYATIPTLISMKKAAGRPRDLDDIEHLEILLKQSP